MAVLTQTSSQSELKYLQLESKRLKADLESAMKEIVKLKAALEKPALSLMRSVGVVGIDPEALRFTGGTATVDAVDEAVNTTPMPPARPPSAQLTVGRASPAPLQRTPVASEGQHSLPSLRDAGLDTGSPFAAQHIESVNEPEGSIFAAQVLICITPSLFGVPS